VCLCVRVCVCVYVCVSVCARARLCVSVIWTFQGTCFDHGYTYRGRCSPWAPRWISGHCVVDFGRPEPWGAYPSSRGVNLIVSSDSDVNNTRKVKFNKNRIKSLNTFEALIQKFDNNHSLPKFRATYEAHHSCQLKTRPCVRRDLWLDVQALERRHLLPSGMLLVEVSFTICLWGLVYGESVWWWKEQGFVMSSREAGFVSKLSSWLFVIGFRCRHKFGLLGMPCEATTRQERVY
jgi:hypothetical protein